MHNCIMLIAGILITGGYDAYSSAEVFLPSTSTSCQLPGLVARHGRDRHSQDGLLACGGGCCGPDPDTSCEEFRPATGSWGYTAFALAKQRAYHGSWGVEEGTILLGGSYSEATSEIVKSDDGFTEFTFDLKYQTQYVVQHNFHVPISLSPGTLAPSRAHPTPP